MFLRKVILLEGRKISMGGLGGVRAWSSGILAITGGVLMVASGFASRGLLSTALNLVEGEIPHYLWGTVGLTATLVVSLIALLIALGGFTVVLGGFSFLMRHRTAGRLLVLLGGGAGILGLLVTFGFATFRLGLGVALGYAPYWIGVALAIFARWMAKGI
jgi:hypothetical protein